MALAARILTALLSGALVSGCGSVAEPTSPTEASPVSPIESSDDATPIRESAPTLAGSLTGAPGPGDWPAYGLDANNSVHNRHEAELGVATVGALVEAWRVETGGVTATPVIVAGIVYFGDWTGTVHAVEARTGAVAWTTAVTDAPISSSAAVSDELVIVGDLAGGLHAVRRADGSSAWSTTVSAMEASVFASPVVVADMVVIGMTDTELSASDDPAFRCSIVAFDVSDGTERWRLFTDPGDSPGLWVTVWSSAAYDAERGLIYIGTGNTNEAAGHGEDEDSKQNLPLADGVLAIVAETGEIAWFTQVLIDDGRDLDIGASPNLFQIGGRDVVGVGGKSGDYVVLDRESGDLIWQTNLTPGSAGGGVVQTAAVDERRVYVASNDGGGPATLFALDAANGAIVWRAELGDAVRGGSMALANGVLYRGLWSGSLVALDAANGSELWRGTGLGLLGGGPAVSNGMLFTGHGSGVPGALRAPEGGLVAWRLGG